MVSRSATCSCRVVSCVVEMWHTHAAWSAWGNQAMASASTRVTVCTPRGRFVGMFCASASARADAGCRQPRFSRRTNVCHCFAATKPRACARRPIDRSPDAFFRQYHDVQILTGLIERQTY
ncbi:unnamed protein product [Parnassius apollo]|uniref:(apollo) hypothetical protein n=1 Tax=Parnassius apollo TaxID=110799 RepID=A0A8S3XR72_PARAO|nr:unnamed protein product [Parnassius apollo]